MTPQQQFWAYFYGWCLALGFVLIIIVIALSASGHLKWIDRWQEHRLKMAELKLRAKLTQSGLDADYVRHLEKKTKE